MRLLLLSIVLGLSAFAQEKKPNIVLIMADDVSWEAFGAYGAQDYRTPHLDQLAASGMQFNHCYSTPICTTSRIKDCRTTAHVQFRISSTKDTDSRILRWTRRAEHGRLG